MTKIKLNRQVVKQAVIEGLLPQHVVWLYENGYIEVPKWSTWKVPDGLPTGGCYGFVAGNLILGSRHHQAIMAELIANGWTWEQLIDAPQVWGWYNVSAASVDGTKEPQVGISFVSDAAIMTAEEAEPCKQAFRDLYKLDLVTGSWENNGGDVKERYGDRFDYGGDFDRHYTEGDNPQVIATPIPAPPEVALV